MAARPGPPSRKDLKAAIARQATAHESIPIASLMKMRSPYNPREMSDEAMAKLRRSIDVAVAEPICVNVKTGNIVGGHQRATAAQLEGWEAFPVWYVDLDLDEEKALNVALNNPNLQGSYDDALLAEILRDLETTKIDLDLTGFSLDERVLIVEGWDSDIDRVDRVAPHTDGIVATIVVECLQADKDKVRNEVADALVKLNIEGARVR
jgi:ParB-like chromosome segregation protein Spo0J